MGWYPVSRGYAVLRDARIADALNHETWPRISPREASDIDRDFQNGSDIYALVKMVASLNPDAGEIGPGMLANLVDRAQKALAKADGEV